MKVLTDLLKEVTHKKHCILQGLMISGIQYDSRKVELGNLFIAVKGFQSDGISIFVRHWTTARLLL